MRIIKEAQQGSDAWLKFRAEHFTASDAPAVQGVSPYKTRDQLLYEKKTGVTEEVTPQKQALFDRGHRAEANGRPTAEEIIGDELYPAVAESTEWSVLGVSFDGLTMDHRIAWENKLYSEKKALVVASGSVPAQDFPQVIQQIHISGAEALLYSICDENGENFQSVWVRREDIDAQPLLAAWAQFQKDLETYEPPEPAEPEAVAAAQTTLPSVAVRVDGEIAVQDNLHEFGQALTAYVENLNLEPATDQEFADLDAAVKRLKEAENSLTSAEENALAQVDEVQQLRTAIHDYREKARQARLAGEKAVKHEKERRKEEIRNAAAKKFADHLHELDRELHPAQMPDMGADIAGAMKGKKTLASLQSAADQAVADAKAEAEQVAAKIRKNLAHLPEKGGLPGGEREHLFRDVAQIAPKEPEDFQALVANRIREEDERLERIRQEEAERQRREQEERERAEREAEEKRQREAEATQEPEPESEPAQPAQGPGEAEEQPELPIEEPETAADQPATLEDYVITIFDDGNGQSVQWNRRTGAVRVMPDGEWMTPEVVQEVA